MGEEARALPSVQGLAFSGACRKLPNPAQTCCCAGADEDGEQEKESGSVWERLGGEVAAPPQEGKGGAASKESPTAEAPEEEEEEPDILFVSDVDAYLAALCSGGGGTATAQDAGEANSFHAAAASGPLSFGVLSRLPLDQQVGRVQTDKERGLLAEAD